MFPCSPIPGRRGTVLMLALAAVVFAHGQPDARSCGRDWLHRYASQPAPDYFVPAVFELSRTDYFNMPNRVLIGLGFFSSLFRQNPDYIDSWLYYSRMLPEQERRLIISALWMAGHPKGEEYLRLYADRIVGPDTAAKLEKLLAEDTSSSPRPQVAGLATLYVRWGEYLASGDEELLYPILEALANDSEVSARDRWWLACTAAQHERVLALCEEEAATAPPALRDAMQLVVKARSGRSLGG